LSLSVREVVGGRPRLCLRHLHPLSQHWLVGPVSAVYCLNPVDCSPRAPVTSLARSGSLPRACVVLSLPALPPGPHPPSPPSVLLAKPGAVDRDLVMGLDNLSGSTLPNTLAPEERMLRRLLLKLMTSSPDMVRAVHVYAPTHAPSHACTLLHIYPPNHPRCSRADTHRHPHTSAPTHPTIPATPPRSRVPTPTHIPLWGPCADCVSSRLLPPRPCPRPASYLPKSSRRTRPCSLAWPISWKQPGCACVMAPQLAPWRVSPQFRTRYVHAQLPWVLGTTPSSVAVPVRWC
jgi:hypothetical protein